MERGNDHFFVGTGLKVVTNVSCTGARSVMPTRRARSSARDIHSVVISPVVDVGPGSLDGAALIESCKATAAALGVRDEALWTSAYEAARAVQLRFDAACVDLGRRALAFCEARGVLPVVVLGRNYTTYNQVLNSNVPTLKPFRLIS